MNVEMIHKLVFFREGFAAWYRPVMMKITKIVIKVCVSRFLQVLLGIQCAAAERYSTVASTHTDPTFVLANRPLKICRHCVTALIFVHKMGMNF